MLAANAATGDTFEDRFPAPQFKDRFPTESETFQQRQPAAAPRSRTAEAEPAPYRMASLAPTGPYERPAREEQTTLVALKSSAFPYLGNNPRTDEPFLNISRGERRGHRGMGGRVFWQDETFNDNRVLMHVPESFDARKPGVIVVFFHGNGATLERDVRDRQLVPQQISDSGVNAVLRSLDFQPGDELLTTNHEYNGCLNALDYVAERAGATVVRAAIPFPIANSTEPSSTAGARNRAAPATRRRPSPRSCTTPVTTPASRSTPI